MTNFTYNLNDVESVEMIDIIENQLEIMYDISTDPLHNVESVSKLNEVRKTIENNINKIGVLEYAKAEVQFNKTITFDSNNVNIFTQFLKETVDMYKDLISIEPDLMEVVENGRKMTIAGTILENIKNRII
jgi:hypothetical protein